MSGVDQEQEGLFEICNTRDLARQLDIVFVHGLGGSSRETWTHREKGAEFFWPAELGADLSKCGIWTLGYPAGITEFFGAPGMRIEKRAGNLSQKLANKDLGDRPIVFICHSMGGLVVKSLLVDSQTQADADRKKIASAVRGIVFLATPHRGSAYSEAAIILGKYFGTAQAHVTEMTRDADSISFLQEKFVEWQRINPVPIDTYAENIGLKQRKWVFRTVSLPVVVTRASADTGTQFSSIKDVDEDHLTIVKPRGRDHDVYAGVLRFVRRVLADLERTNDRSDANIADSSVHAPSTGLSDIPDQQKVRLRKVDLSLGSVGLDSNDAPTLVNVLLTSDEPERLNEAITNWKVRIANDSLGSASVRGAREMSLSQLLTLPTARGRLLEWLSVTPFSAYLYFSPGAARTALDPETLRSRLLIQPLVHRLSKRTQIVAAIHCDRDISEDLELASKDIENRFHRTAQYSTTGPGAQYRRQGQLELVKLIAELAAGHLGAVQSPEASSAFAHVRTRIRFCENVLTQERHTRDRNPIL